MADQNKESSSLSCEERLFILENRQNGLRGEVKQLRTALSNGLDMVKTNHRLHSANFDLLEKNFNKKFDDHKNRSSKKISALSRVIQMNYDNNKFLDEKLSNLEKLIQHQQRGVYIT